uniref:KIB1-4 beta-propeller domain-containing protein n=1 Tax=Hordeum vulgare subsp. vulgare TaxID=112509 RepID=A0A8I6X619_HORVV
MEVEPACPVEVEPTPMEVEVEVEPTPNVWEDAPDNILLRVAAFLPFRLDRLRMCSVNPHWRRALCGWGQGRPPQLPLLPPLAPLLPWLVFPNTEEPSLFCAMDRISYPLRLPRDVRNARFCGSCEGGWFLLALDMRPTQYALYNLYFGHRIPVPGGLTIPDDTGAGNRPLVLRAATFTSSPTAAGPNGYMIGAIALVCAKWCAAFWREGLPNWITSESDDLWMSRPPQDVKFVGGAFFFITADENIVTYCPTLAGDENQFVMRRFDCDMLQRDGYADDLQGNASIARYLVDSRGVLHMVLRYIYNNQGTTRFRVFKFQVLPQLVDGVPPPASATWVSVSELDGQMLFLGRGCSRSIEVEQFLGFDFEGSTIYFPDDRFIPNPEPTVDNRRSYSFIDMGKYSLQQDGQGALQPWPPVDRRPARSDRAPPTWWLH